MNTNLKTEIYDCFNAVCEKLDILPIKFEHITKNGGHPNIHGMIDIKNEVLKAL